MSNNDYILKLLNIEDKNNLVKAIKRIAFGYRSYDYFISRIFLIKNNIKG
ncbi:MAG: transposase [Bacilli bacterium]|nr:transposase [Bacilli bacterium]